MDDRASSSPLNLSSLVQLPPNIAFLLPLSWASKNRGTISLPPNFSPLPLTTNTIPASFLPFPNRVAASGALGVVAEPRDGWPLNAQGLPERPDLVSTRHGFCYLHWGPFATPLGPPPTTLPLWVGDHPAFGQFYVLEDAPSSVLDSESQWR